MKTEMDLKTLWHKQEADEMPDIKALFKEADNIKLKMGRKLLLKNALLLSVAGYMVYLGFNIPDLIMTAKIGLGIMIAGMLIYLSVFNQGIPLLFKTNFEVSSHEYLEQLIAIRRREDFLNRVMMNIYYAMISVGISLYFVQFSHKLWVAVFAYSITLAWIIFSWTYLRPRGVKRKQKPLLETIARLEELNKQLEKD